MFAGALALVLLCIRPAAAHTELQSSNPEDGAKLAKPPPQVTLTFSEAVNEPAYVVVTAPDGTRVADGDAAILDDTVRQPLDAVDAEAQAGGWTVAYRVVSVDGHPITGELVFAVEARADRTSSTPTTAAPEEDSSGGGAGHSDSGSHHTAHAGAADHSQAAGWREYAHWLQLPLAALALGGLYLWSLPRRRRDA